LGVLIKDLYKSYGSHLVLKGVNLEIKDGELFVILGYSGSGKTTLLRCIAGLEKVDSGRIYIDGVDVTGLPPAKRSLRSLPSQDGIREHIDAHREGAGRKEESP